MAECERLPGAGKTNARYGHTVASKAIMQHKDIQPCQWGSSAMKKECASATVTSTQWSMNIST